MLVKTIESALLSSLKHARKKRAVAASPSSLIKYFSINYIASVTAGIGLVYVGRYLPGSSWWGINHLSYICNDFVLLLALVLLAVLIPPALQNCVNYLEKKPKPWSRGLMQLLLFGLLAAVSVWFRQRTFFMGDGYLLLDLIRKGIPFRILDNMDYASHVVLAKVFFQFGHGPRASYVATSIIAIAALVFGLIPLVAKLRWDLWRRIGATMLILGSGSAQLLMGYVESYTLLYVCISAYTIAGLLVIQGRMSPWVASALLALALAFHLSALLAAPSLLVFIINRSETRLRDRLAQVVGPVFLALALSLGVHFALGYGPGWFDQEILQADNLRSALWSPSGPYGSASIYSVLSHLNTALILYPVSGIVTMLGIARLVRARKQADIAFLLVLVICYGVASLVLERHLGAARDWDLLAAHTTCISLLAIAALPRGNQLPTRIVGLVVVTVVMTVPWVAVNASVTASVARFQDILQGFPPYARGYAYEGLAQYYREKGELEAAVEFYEECVSASPGNARFHSLLGTAYLSMVQNHRRAIPTDTYLDSAERSYLKALELGYAHPDAYRGLVYILLRQERYDEAIPRIIDLLERWTGSEKDWVTLIQCYQRSHHFPSRETAEKLIRLGPPESVQAKLERYILHPSQ